MTTLRTDIIPNLYPNPIVSISQANPAVVTVPVVAAVVSATGTIGTVTGSGTSATPWTATLSNMASVAGLITGQIITATAGTGTFAAGGVVVVAAILSNTSITINKIGGTIPTAGTVTDVTAPARSTLPIGIANGDAILFTNPGNKLTVSTAQFTATGCSVSGTTLTIGTKTSGTIAVGQVIQSTSILNNMQIVANISGSGNGSTWTISGTPGTLSGLSISGFAPTFVSGEIITQATSAAQGLVTNVLPGALEYTAISGVFDTTHKITGATSGSVAIPSAVTGMNELLTAGATGNNLYYYKNVDSTSFELYTDSALTTGVDSSAFTAATPNAGQYTTFDTVVITVNP